MEALEFMKEAKRMCLAIGCCSDCNLGYGCAIDGVKNLPDIVLESNCLVVEQWSKEHPIITNARKFKEVFGFNGDTVNKVKPEKGIAGTKGSCGYYECRESCGARHFPRCPMWWDDEYKEPEHD